MIPGDVTKKFNIPIEHLDFGYIEKCTDVRELAKILKILRSNDEGYYPDLERFCENRITALDPDNRILRKETPARTKYDLPPEEWKDISGDLSQWLEEMTTADTMKAEDAKMKKKIVEITDEEEGSTDDADDEANENMPPVRGTNIVVPTKLEQPKSQDAQQQQQQEQPPKPSPQTNGGEKKPAVKKKAKRVKPREYREWDKINVDEELKKLDEEEAREAENKKKLEEEKKPQQTAPVTVLNNSPSHIPKLAEINKSALSEEELAMRAEREKEKGNEAFRAGDFEEALAYYNRSLSLQLSMAVLNNRAFTYLKMEKWEQAIKDCNTVLAEDPKNIKALFRRASSYKSRKQFVPAKKDLEKVISIDSSHAKALEMLESVKKSIEATKKDGNRLVIEEVSESSEEDDTHFDGKSTLAHNNLEASAKATAIINHDKHPDEHVQQPQSHNVNHNHNHNHNEVRSQQQQSAPPPPPPTTTIKQVNGNAKTPQPAKNKEEKSIWGESDEVTVLPQKKVEEKPKLVSLPQAWAEDKPKATPNKYKDLPIAELLDKMTSLKDLAGKLFAEGKYSEALAAYSEGIEAAKERCHPKDAASPASAAQMNNLRYVYGLLLANVAACYLKTGALNECIRFCTESLLFLPNFAKSHLRRATAYEALKQFDEALNDYSQLLALEPASKPGAEGKSRCEAALKVEKKVDDLGTRILIEEDDSAEDEEEEVVEEKPKKKSEITSPRRHVSVPVVVPKLPPNAGAFEFAQAWTCLVKSCNLPQENDEQPDVDFVSYRPLWELLKQIPSSQISKVFANQFDGTNLSAVINCIFYAICLEALDADQQLATDHLLQVASVPRFSVAAMFLEERERANLRSVIQTLISSKIDQNRRTSLEKTFSSYK